MNDAATSFGNVMGEMWSEASKFGDSENRFKLSLSCQFLFGRMYFFVEAKWFEKDHVHVCEGPKFTLADGPEWVTITHRLREVTEMVRRKKEKLSQLSEPK